MIAKLKMTGIESVFDLAIFIPHQLVDIGDGMLTGTDEHVALELVNKAKKTLVDSGLLLKDFSTAQEILDRRKNLVRCTTGSAKLDSYLDLANDRTFLTWLRTCIAIKGLRFVVARFGLFLREFRIKIMIGNRMFQLTMDRQV